MWYLIAVLLLAAVLVGYVAVRQARHPVPPGRRPPALGEADPDSRDWSGPPTGSGF